MGIFEDDPKPQKANSFYSDTKGFYAFNSYFLKVTISVIYLINALILTIYKDTIKSCGASISGVAKFVISKKSFENNCAISAESNAFL